MLSSEIKINGRFIGILCMVNSGFGLGAETLYHVEYLAQGRKKFEFDVMHTPSEGAEVLTSKCMIRLCKEMAMERERKEKEKDGKCRKGRVPGKLGQVRVRGKAKGV
jgi:hypothetical protein